MVKSKIHVSVLSPAISLVLLPCPSPMSHPGEEWGGATARTQSSSPLGLNGIRDTLLLSVPVQLRSRDWTCPSACSLTASEGVMGGRGCLVGYTLPICGMRALGALSSLFSGSFLAYVLSLPKLVLEAV